MIGRSAVVALVATVAMILSGLVYPAAGNAYASGLTLSRQAVAPGDQITVSGSGYTPRDSVIVFADFSVAGATRRSQTAASAQANGSFTATLSVPAGTAAGLYQVQARDFHNHAATQTIVVRPLATLAVGAHAQTITVVAQHAFFMRGSGFKGGEPVTITGTFPLYNGNSVNVTKTVAADAHGNLGEVAIQVPAGARTATVTFSARGQSSKKTAQANVSVVYRPAVSLNYATARPGATIVVHGTGYVPGTAVHVSITVPRQGAQTVTVTRNVTPDAQGAFTASLTLPQRTSPGTFNVTATDTVGNVQASAKLTVTLKPAIALAFASIAPGHAVPAKGSGFSANSDVRLTVTVPLYGGGSHLVTQTVHTDANGNFSTQLNVPPTAAAGRLTIVATGPNERAQTFLTVQHVPVHITVSPAQARPGSTAAVVGTGYPAGDRVVITIQVRLSNGATSTLSTTAQADARGMFTAAVGVPGQVSRGTYTVLAKSSSTGRAAQTQLRVVALAALSVPAIAIAPGHVATVSGHGFSGGVNVTVSANVALYGGGSKTVTTTVRTNGAGAFTAQLIIPRHAAAGSTTIVARGPNSRITGTLQIGHILARISLSASSIIPGTGVTVTGAGYPANDVVNLTVAVKTTAGAARTIGFSTRVNGQGSFSAVLRVPTDIAGGTYTVIAASTTTGRAPRAQLAVIKLAPSIVASPGTVQAGTQVMASGFGFAAGQHVTLTLNGKSVGTAVTGADGKFSVKFMVSANLASGPYALTAATSRGLKATSMVTVARVVSTHFYFASVFTGTGHQEYLDFVNPTSIRARVTITYQRTVGAPTVKTITVNPTSRYTENANVDLGPRVSAGASVASDVPIGAALVNYQGNEGSTIPGSHAPSTVWYFANGNTSKAYREYLAIENPNNGPVQAVVHLFPTHHRPITLYRTIPASARITVKVNTFVRDAVGATVTANSPIVVNRTVKIHHGIDSKNGVSAAHGTWYFAAGPRDPRTRYWIGLVNPSGRAAYVTVKAYGQLGRMLGIKHQWVKAGGRVGYLINRLAHQTDAAVVVTASSPVVAEQMTYVGGKHNAGTDTFGVYAPARAWTYAAVDTTVAHGASDYLDLFNPSGVALPVVVQFVTTGGHATARTYVVGPFAHVRVNVGSVEPNATLGIVATSDRPFVGLNRAYFNHRLGGMTSQGVQP